MTMFEVVARLKVREGELEGFKRQAAEVLRQAKEKDTKTIRYDWFLSDDGSKCEVREGYVDPDGLLEHSDHVGEVRAELFRDYAYDHDMTLYGEPSPALVQAFEAMAGHVVVHRFTLLSGLPDGVTPDAVFEACARLTIRDGELEGFKRQVAEIMNLTQQQDVKPLQYDWFLSDDGAECEVREAYIDADGLLDQQRRIGKAKAELFRYVTGHSMTFYAEPSPALVETMKARGATFKQFSFFQGLRTDVRARDEVAV
jgi:quinol monooxygenase YgiN